MHRYFQILYHPISNRIIEIFMSKLLNRILFTTMVESAFGMFLAKKRNTKNNVWQNFSLMATEDGKVVEKEQDKLICRSCGKGVFAKGSSNTNLFQHLWEHYPLIFAELAPSQSLKSKSTKVEFSSKQAMLTETIARSAKYFSGNAQAKELNHAVTY